MLTQSPSVHGTRDNLQVPSNSVQKLVQVQVQPTDLLIYPTSAGTLAYVHTPAHFQPHGKDVPKRAVKRGHQTSSIQNPLQSSDKKTNMTSQKVVPDLLY